MSRTLVSVADYRRSKIRNEYWAVLVGTTAVFAAVFLFPMYWLIAGALRSPAELADTTPSLIPRTFQPGNYADAWNSLQIAHFFLKTVEYAAGGWLIQLLVDVAAAYALSRLRPVFGKVVLGAILASLMLPAAALLVPTYLTVADLPIFHRNLLSTPWALWLPGAANAVNIWLLKRFFDQLPQDLLDAASIDGAGRLTTLTRIVLPLSRPVLAVVSIFAIVGIWKDFLWPYLVLQDPEAQTLSVALARLSTTSYVTPNELLAGMVIASVPMVVVFLVFQRHILAGLSAGSLKG
jgi:multiple sugar transport system permease protein